MWHADIQQAHFELEDAEAEKALTVVTGTRPVFLIRRTACCVGAVTVTLSNRASCRRRLPMSDVFADAEEAELTAATIEERLNFFYAYEDR